MSEDYDGFPVKKDTGKGILDRLFGTQPEDQRYHMMQHRRDKELRELATPPRIRRSRVMREPVPTRRYHEIDLHGARFMDMSHCCNLEFPYSHLSGSRRTKKKQSKR